jgi:hypothetical protein
MWNTMSIEKIDVADLDVIYLTYDEPKKEEFWIQIQNMVPWAKRVDGIFGSDAAHKAAADASDTVRFILIDGDNIPDPAFFNQQMVLDDNTRDCVFRWRARNTINGLQYGNGGLSSWTKDFVYNMRTHEASDGTAETLVEFCFHPKYWAMADVWSTTYPNGSAFQAWRAGFREGVKMCLDRGSKPSITEFNSRVASRNYDNLCIWQTVGRDVENGHMAIHGARLGTYLTMLTDWDYTEVQDFTKLKELWDKYSAVEYMCEDFTFEVDRALKTRLGLPVTSLNAEQSRFFKHHYKSNFKNQGIMVRE